MSEYKYCNIRPQASLTPLNSEIEVNNLYCIQLLTSEKVIQGSDGKAFRKVIPTSVRKRNVFL